MLRTGLATLALVAVSAGAGAAAEFDAGAAHGRFVDAFNQRQWSELKSGLADDIVFHRANAGEVYSGPDAVVGRFEKTIGGEWNVKFAILESTSQFAGKDGRVVERGDFAVTAGADDGSCYRGSYMMTWLSEAGDWKLQMLAWQDVETELGNCQ